MKCRNRRSLSALAAALVAACAAFHVPPSPPLPPSAAARRVSRPDALADLDALLTTLERVHPDLYAVWTRSAAEAARARLVAQLPTSMTRAEWWLQLAPFVAAFGDGHTAALIPGEELERGGEFADALLFPPSVTIGAEDHLVVSVPFGARGIARGDRLVRVIGMDADSLVTSWSAAISGESWSYRRESVAQLFRTLLTLHGVAAPYRVDVATDSDTSGATRTIAVAGISRDSFAAILRRPRAPQANAPGTGLHSRNFTYRVLQPGIGYMDFRSMADDLGAFRADVAAMFRQVAADSDRALIVDLRNNGGGDSRLGEAFLAHVTTVPYRTNARKEWKMSAEYRAYFASGLAWPIRALRLWTFSALGRAMFRAPTGAVIAISEAPKARPAADPFFRGPVCVLIGPRTFSSASDIADAIKTYHLATLIGEETGGRVNTFGEVYPFRLPRSSLQIVVSSARFVRASGDSSDARGVIPDVVVAPSAADFRAGRDPVLDRATRCR